MRDAFGTEIFDGDVLNHKDGNPCQIKAIEVCGEYGRFHHLVLSDCNRVLESGHIFIVKGDEQLVQSNWYKKRFPLFEKMPSLKTRSAIVNNCGEGC